MIELECKPGRESLQAVEAVAGASVAGLYVHVPFCFHKCHYCDFYSFVDAPKATPATPGIDPTPADRVSPTTPPAREAVFVERLIAELGWRAQHMDLRPRTIFVGGGTPTLLSSEAWANLLSGMADLGVLDRVTEFTVEANPETVTTALAQTLARGGVNRVSIGAQSFEPTMLATLERWHEPASVARAVQRFREAGVSNISLDLIFAAPGQTLGMLDADLDAALALQPTHLSCYALIFEPNTPLTVRMRQGRIQPMDEEDERTMLGRVMARLAEAGFEHYEISNWARLDDGASGRITGGALSEAREGAGVGASPWRSAHNLLYWRGEDWLGVGPSAASHIAGRRWRNEPHLGRYLSQTPAPPTTDHEQLPADRRVGESLMMQLRLLEGVPGEWLAANLPADDPRHQTIRDLVDWGMLTWRAGRLRLTEQGLFLGDAVVQRLL